ncbi:helix-turn-helix transcriptional regulator [Motilimonas cestriensis]|uniref:Helix-turn-helix transcriptional regulator n=1 Tax=Motilimonas cestriensis TaxID=2742685 RepID=A0ABS8WAU1_9GAMM|nr:helix-turn-helix transcriptional regulator [Motilimonas cestriensis]MCE2595633.1 helix-turn-helix transcriptional regulator [Motilimonas cestriensis]
MQTTSAMIEPWQSTKLNLMTTNLKNTERPESVPSKPFILVPEMALLEQLPPHLQARFEKALQLMHQTLFEGLTWQQVAKRCAISPSHFHRQFTQVWHETPGQYLNRIRLQIAVYELFELHQYNITDIAHRCGYSSSQALAKALKRELNMSAKALREMAYNATPEQTAQLLEKIAHPTRPVLNAKPKASISPAPQAICANNHNSHTLEQQLAQDLPCQLIWYPERRLSVTKQDNFSWDREFVTKGNKTKGLFALSPVNQLERPWHEMEVWLGTENTNSEANLLLPAGNYLCTEVYLVSDIGYIAAWQGLLDYAERHQHQIDQTGYSVEQIRDLELTLTGGATFAMQVPIL